MASATQLAPPLLLDSAPLSFRRTLELIHRIYALISPQFRRRRQRWFQRTCPLDPADRILDVGGYPWFWRESALRNPITLLNLAFPAGLAESSPDYAMVVGDGCALPYADNSFDLVFSNSVIEHVGSWSRQQAFASEVRRVGGRLWVQTPAYGFFIEPHLIAPFVHWLPTHWQSRLLRNFTPWGWLTRPTPEKVAEFLAEVRLLKRAEMQILFPDCEIMVERFLGLPKSYIAVRRE